MGVPEATLHGLETRHVPRKCRLLLTCRRRPALAVEAQLQGCWAPEKTPATATTVTTTKY